MNDNSKKILQSNEAVTKHHKRIQSVIERLKICALMFVSYFILNLFHMGCPIKFTTGISCPGCGMTRAVLSVLRLDFQDAFHYHPLFMLAPIIFLLFLFESYIKPKYCKGAWTVIIILFIVTYLIRLIFMESSVVRIDFQSGIVLRLIHKISGIS